MTNTWSADVPVSMPKPLDESNPALVGMFGFAFTERGLFHDLTPAEHEELRQPSFSPNLDWTGVEFGDTEFSDG